MLWILKDRSNAIGVDMGDDTLKLAQLENNCNSINLVYGSSKRRPAEVRSATADWQKWAIDAIKEMVANGKFKGKDVVAAIPANEVFVEHVRMPKTENIKTEDAILSRIKQKLPFPVEQAMLKYIPTEEDNAIVIVTERTKIDRHLAIYEKANLKLKSIGVWPLALSNTYTSFFGRRKSDLETVVMLLDIEPNCTNVVVCRHKSLLFVRSVPIGKKQILEDEKTITRLSLELNASKRQFSSMYKNAKLDRTIFMSGQAVEKEVYTALAKQLEMPAQMGDCLAAVEIKDPLDSGIERRNCDFSWATAFGLSLS